MIMEQKMPSLQQAYKNSREEKDKEEFDLLQEFAKDYLPVDSLMLEMKSYSKVKNGIVKINMISELYKTKLPELKMVCEFNDEKASYDELKEHFVLCALISNKVKTHGSGDLFMEFSESPEFALLTSKSTTLLESFSDKFNELNENEKQEIKETFLFMPVLLSRSEVNEMKKALSLEVDSQMLMEQDFQGRQKQIIDVIGKLEKILNALNQDISEEVPDKAEFPRVKNGLLTFASDFRQAAAEGRAGAKKGFKSLDAMIVQAHMVLSMFEALSKNWNYIQTVLKPEIKKIENPLASIADGTFNKVKSLISTMIIRTISKSGSGKWGERIAAIARTIKGKINYPISITPAIVANDIVDLISKTAEVTAEQQKNQTQAQPAQAQTPATQQQQAPAPAQGQQPVNESVIVKENLDSVLTLIDRLGDVFKKAEPGPMVQAQPMQQPQAPQQAAGQAQAPQQTNQPAQTQAAPTAAPAAQQNAEQVTDLTDEEAKEEFGLAKGLTTMNKIKQAVLLNPELKSKLKKFFEI